MLSVPILLHLKSIWRANHRWVLYRWRLIPLRFFHPWQPPPLCAWWPKTYHSGWRRSRTGDPMWRASEASLMQGSSDVVLSGLISARLLPKKSPAGQSLVFLRTVWWTWAKQPLPLPSPPAAWQADSDIKQNKIQPLALSKAPSVMGLWLAATTQQGRVKAGLQRVEEWSFAKPWRGKAPKITIELNLIHFRLIP